MRGGSPACCEAEEARDDALAEVADLETEVRPSGLLQRTEHVPHAPLSVAISMFCGWGLGDRVKK